MAQAGIHGLIGMAAKKYFPDKAWLAVGVVAGSVLPDADALVVAVATLAGWSSERLHRTFTHSILMIVLLVLGGYLAAALIRDKRYKHLGIGLAAGVLMHVLVDLIVWFRGVELFWPLPLEVNFWKTYVPPAWWYDHLELPLEFLLMAVFFWYMGKTAQSQGTDGSYLSRLRIWGIVMLVLFVVFTPLVYLMESGFMMVFGVFYLLMLWLGISIPFRMYTSIEMPKSTEISTGIEMHTGVELG